MGSSCDASNAVQCPAHSGLVADIVNIKDLQKEQTSLISKLFDKFDEIKVHLLDRPGWLVCTIISVESSIIAAETVFILYNVFKS
jgi:hypothetical protein